MDRKRPGQTYERFCVAMGKDKQGPDPSILVGTAERKHLARMHHIQLGLDEARNRDGFTSAKKMERLMEKEKRRYEKEKRKILQPDFHEAVQYLGMKVSPEQAVKAAFIVSASSFFGFLVAYVSLTMFHPMLMKALQNFLLPMGLALPVLLFGFMASYPEILAKRIRTASLGKTPEPINYMTMSLRTSPSLERAVAFAAEHCEEPMSTNLRRVIWEVALRKHYSVEDSLTEFAYRWGRWNDDFKRALYVIRGAVLEKTREGFERSLEKAHAIALSGAKEKVEEFASRLSGPATILFALGVVLPLLIGAAIPMQNMQMPTNMAYEQNPEPDMASPAILVMAMNILFPSLAFFYSYTIVGKRPGTISPPDVSEKGKGNIALAALCASIPLLFYLPHIPVGVEIPFSLPDLGLLPILLSFSLGAGVYLISSSSAPHAERKRLLAMEKDLPDALYQLGNRMAEGQPLETAFSSVSSTMKNSPISPLFRDISTNLSISHTTLGDILLSPSGVLSKYNSRALHASMRSLVEAVKKDPLTAGKTTIMTANYLKDLQKVDHDIKTKLQGVVDMMRTTSLFFAPMVIGMTVAMYSMLSGQFEKLGSAPGLTDMAFAFIMGFYLIESTFVTAYFSVGILNGGDRIAMARILGFSWPISILLFTFTVYGGQTMLG